MPSNTSYTVYVTTNTGGSVSPSGSNTVSSGGSLKMYAYPNAGYKFSYWRYTTNGGSTWSYSYVQNPTTSNVTSNEVWGAHFEALTKYEVYVQSAGNGSVSPAGSNYVTSGGSLKMYATPDSGYKFSYWGYTVGGGNLQYSYVQNPTTSNVTAREVWTAAFEKIVTYQLIMQTDGNGATSPATGTWDITEGNSVTLKAGPNSNYEFDYWEYYTASAPSTKKTSTSNPYTISSMSEGMVFKAHFKLKTTTYTLSYDSNGGSGAPSSESKTKQDIQCVFNVSTQKPTRDNYNFVGWSFDKDATSSDYDPGDKLTLYIGNPTRTLYAVWSQKHGPDTVTVDTSGKGTAFIQTVGTTQKVLYTIGQDCYLLARETTDGWSFKGWELDGEIVSTATQIHYYKTNIYEKTVNYTAVFVQGVRVKVNYDSEKCSVSGQGNYAYGETCTITVVPKEGYKFNVLYNNGTGLVTSRNPYTYTITNLDPDANKWTVRLVRTYHLHVTVNDETLGSATGEGWYEEGTTVEVIATAKSGGKFLYFSVNGDVYESADHTYTAYVGTKQINVIAVFQESEYEYEPRESSSGLDKSNIYYRAQNVQEDGVYGYNPYTGENNPLEPECDSTGNCTWYAQGRSAEIAGKDIRNELPNMHDGGMWFGETDLCPWAREGYVNPAEHDGEELNIALGDIACFTGLSHGHVEIIEEITDTMVVTSQSSWDNTHQWEYLFALSTSIPGISKSYYSRDEFKVNRRAALSSSLHLQGVIHNPYIGTPGSKKPTEATITIENTTGGDVYIDGVEGGGTTGVAVGQVITLYAKPKKGYKFISWSDGIVSNPRKYTVTGTITLYPIYERLTDVHGVLFLTPYGDSAMII